MATKLISQEWCPCVNDSRKEFLCDTDADLENLPEACIGSTAVSIESGSVRVVNTSGEWVPFAESGGNGGAEVKTFYLNDSPYEFEEGMTWGEFIESSYNTDNFVIADWGLVGYKTTDDYGETFVYEVQKPNAGGGIYPTEEIIANEKYEL